LYRALAPVQDALLDITSRFYAVVDYPDEDIEDIHPAQIAQALTAAEDALARLLGTARRGKILKNGVRTAIVGRPNAGKSSLLNALAGYERAIVTDIPGTTRDTVEETVLCGDVALRLIDTAGIRDTEDTVEKLGVARSRAAMDSADLVLAVVDGSAPMTQEDLEVLRLASHCPRWIAVFSKCDLWNTKARSVGVIGSVSAPAASVTLSSVTGEGMEDLERAVAELFPAGANADAGALLTDARQEEAALRARRAVVRAREALEAGFTPDAVLTDAEEALEAVGELTGRTAREEIVERIFSRFCVGK
ncbi:MAG: 50S ribosome-binding GTPase, partial [Oscillospiraceae bacterium]|nr:50S ribosome-binding GTPase [Oscillospiraceae bacterium]